MFFNNSTKVVSSLPATGVYILLVLVSVVCWHLVTPLCAVRVLVPGICTLISGVFNVLVSSIHCALGSGVCSVLACGVYWC